MSEKRQDPRVEDMAALCKRTGVPFPRHMRGKRGDTVTWVDAVDFQRLLKRLDQKG